MGRRRNGEKIAAASAVLLFAFMYLDWFGSKDDGELRLFSVGRNPGRRSTTSRSFAIEGTVQFPIYLALAAAVGIAFGGCWAMRE